MATKREARSQPRQKAKRSAFDMTFLILVILLLTIGLVMLFSASYANAYYLKGNSFHYISRQLVFAVAGVVAMYVASFYDYHNLHNWAYLIVAGSVVLLIMVFFMPPVNDAHRWIFIGPINFQPSEIAKFGLIVLFSHWISVNQKEITTIKGLIPYAAVMGLFSVLLIAEPHLSGTILMIAIGVVMIVVGGARLIHLFTAGLAGATALIAAVVALGKLDRALGRIEHWLDPFSDPRGDGFQTIQSLYAIGSGGMMGTGIGDSRQKYLFLPEPQNDFIFAIVCEELGFIGATLIIMLFALLIWRGFVIGMHAKDKFGALLAVGLTAQIGIQVLLNIAVATNSVPNTGIGLPFFSYGGTSLLMLLGQIGIILSVSRQSNLEKE